VSFSVVEQQQQQQKQNANIRKKDIREEKVFVCICMGGRVVWWGRREKNPNIVSSLRGEKSLTKKNV
jgi:hypothetical protein